MPSILSLPAEVQLQIYDDLCYRSLEKNSFYSVSSLARANRQLYRVYQAYRRTLIFGYLGPYLTHAITSVRWRKFLEKIPYHILENDASEAHLASKTEMLEMLPTKLEEDGSFSPGMIGNSLWNEIADEELEQAAVVHNRLLEFRDFAISKYLASHTLRPVEDDGIPSDLLAFHPAASLRVFNGPYEWINNWFSGIRTNTLLLDPPSKRQHDSYESAMIEAFFEQVEKEMKWVWETRLSNVCQRIIKRKRFQHHSQDPKLLVELLSKVVAHCYGRQTLDMFVPLLTGSEERRLRATRALGRFILRNVELLDGPRRILPSVPLARFNFNLPQRSLRGPPTIVEEDNLEEMRVLWLTVGEALSEAELVDLMEPWEAGESKWEFDETLEL